MMSDYKKDFLDFLYECGVLKFNAEFRLKNNRLSPYFINIGELNQGASLRKLGEAYAAKIASLKVPFDLLFGPSYKGIPIVVAAAMILAEKEINVGIAFNRKEAKKHGEGSDLKNSQKSFIVGRELRDHDRVLILDDVITTAETKYDMIEFIQSLASAIEIQAFIIGVDRQEVGIDGKNAIEELTKTTGIPVISIISSYDIYRYLESRGDVEKNLLMHVENYLRVYGTQTMKEQLGNFSPQTIIKEPVSIIPACDISTLEEYEDLIQQTADIEKVGGYKLGFELALQFGLPQLVARARNYTDKPLIYDHQKAGTDIPDTGKEFAQVCKNAGIDTVILFPQAGPETERAWIYHALDKGLNVIVGGIMSHKAYTVREGGFISDEGALEIYKIAARAGINNFVVPATKPGVIKQVKDLVQLEGVSPTFFLPGLFTQGGTIAEVKNVCGGNFHPIVGREITKAANKQQAVLEIIKQL